tara:strand:+ start:2010 stop:2300 length:291 start_codon:yes stop_codon:yes gene_type:complete
MGLILENIDKLEPMKRFIASKFPYEVDENGCCTQLNEDGNCNVYDHRPVLCNVRLMSKFSGESELEYFKKSAKACNQIMDDWGVEEEYRIDLEESF